ncbi:MAG: hypothetical protein ACOC0U_02200, partial [Desulfovibrionales bacterium]
MEGIIVACPRTNGTRKCRKYPYNSVEKRHFPHREERHGGGEKGLESEPGDMDSPLFHPSV